MAPALTRPVDVVLHLGTGKAGSTSIQFFLRDNRERLVEHGVLYPRSPGAARHSRLGLFAKPPAELLTSPEWARQKEADPARFRRLFRRRLLAEIERYAVPRLLLSDEILFGASVQTLRRLGRFVDQIATDLRVVVYLRRQDDHMVSRYQQGVKIGWVQRLAEWAHEDMSSLYDYRARLRIQKRLLGPSSVVVRPFEAPAFHDGSLYQDFLDAAGIEAGAADWETAEVRHNESLDAESVELLRLLNIYRVENEHAVSGLIDNAALVPRLADASSGPVLTMPEPFLDSFMSQWEESNSRVARDFLRDPGGRLFRVPRKTRNTTTEQVLDPARLDHWIEVLELPEALRAPLRRVVEREAKRP